MRLRGIHIRNMGPHRDFSVDFDALGDAKIVAVCGENGSGKTVFLELLTGGALYRECRTRGSLASLATTRDASLEVLLDNGQPWTIRHTVDCVSGKGESIATDASGNAVTSTGKVRDYDAWAASHLPGPELLYGSQVLAQGSGGFLDLKPSDRKGVILRLLGVERLEPMSKSSRERAREADAKARGTEQSIRMLEETADVETAEASLEQRKHDEHSAGWLAAEAQSALDVAKELAGNSALAWERYREQKAAREDLGRKQWAASNSIEAIEIKIRKDCNLVTRRANMMGLDATVGEAKRQLEEARAVSVDLQRRIDACAQTEARRKELTAELAKATTELQGIEKRLANNRAVLDKADEIRSAIAKREQAIQALPRFEEAERLAQEAVDAADALLDELSSERHAGADTRIKGLRTGLELARDVACSDGDYAYEIAKGALENDDATVEAAESLPRRKAEAEAARRSVMFERTSATAARIACAKLATETHPNEPQLATAEARIAELTPQHETAALRVLTLREAAANLPAPERLPYLPNLAALQDTLDAAQRGLDADRVAYAKAEEAQAHLTADLERLRSEQTSLQEQLDATPEPVPPEQSPDLTALEQALREAQQSAQRTIAAVGAAEAKLQAARDAMGRIDALRTEHTDTRAEQADWTRLADDLGRDGLQAALIDSACAELTAISNDLLHSCLGTRWTVSLETQRASADGKKQLEGFDVRVLDTEAGRDTTVETLSGGEKALVGEAISLALTTLACRGIESPTLVRDETSAALDPGKARAYVAMLRRAAQQIGADRVLFVSHSIEVQEMADARIEIRGAA